MQGQGRVSCNIRNRPRRNRLFPPSSGRDKDVRPYITLVAELGAQHRPSSMVVTNQIAHPTDVHPHKSIFAYGCSDTVYNVIARSDRPLYKHLLANRDFLDEHGRADASPLGAVRRMNPFWTAGNDCYHWIQDPFLNKSENRHDDDDNDNGYGELQVGTNKELSGDSSEDDL